jgi:hypothetical protein
MPDHILIPVVESTYLNLTTLTRYGEAKHFIIESFIQNNCAI